MTKVITLTDIKLKEILIAKDPKLTVNLLFQRLDDTGEVHDIKRVLLAEDDFTSAQITKFTDILSTIATKAKQKEGL